MADTDLNLEEISVTAKRIPDDGSLDDKGNPVEQPRQPITELVGGSTPSGNPVGTQMGSVEDDLSQDYLNQQAPMSDEDFKQQLADIESGKIPPEDNRPPIDLSEEDDGVEGVGGYAADVAYGVANGVINAGTEINHTLANIADFLAPRAWQEDPEYFTKLADEYSPRVTGDMLGEVGLKVPASTAGNITKGIAQFMVGFVPALKAVKGIQAISSVSKAAMTLKTGVGVGTAGAVADLSVFNPYEKRLSNMAKESGIPGFDNAITQYLSANEDDPELLGRVKQTAEGFIIGKVLEPFIALLGATRKAKTVYAEEHGMKPPSQLTASYITDIAKSIPPPQEGFTRLYRGQKGDFPPAVDYVQGKGPQEAGRWFSKNIADAEMYSDVLAKGGKVRYVDVPNSVADDVENLGKEWLPDSRLLPSEWANQAKDHVVTPPSIVDVNGQSMDSPRFTLKDPIITIPDEAIQKDFTNAYLDGDYEGAARKLSTSINIKSITDEEGVRDLINGVAHIREMAIGKNTRGWEESAIAAGKLTPEDAVGLSARTEGLDTQLINARDTRDAVAYVVRDLAVANKGTPTLSNQLAFDDAAKVLTTLSAMVDGSASEVGRALNVLKRQSNGSRIADTISSAMKSTGSNGGRLLSEVIADMPDTVSILRAVKAASLPKWKDALTEVWINNFFSPLTFAVNGTSNFLSAGGAVAERYLGAAKSQLSGTGELTFREANHYALGLAKGIADGVSAFSQAWKTNAPVMGTGNKFIDGAHHNAAFSGAAFGIKDSDSPLWQHIGTGLDYIGTGLRSMPGGTRSLMATDEFFKAIFYKGELSALAQREATKSGLTKGTPEYLAKVSEVLEGVNKAKVGDPYYGISMASQDHAARQTFTENFGEGGELLLEGARHFRETYIVLPFIKTPVNLVKYMARRTPGLAGHSSYMLKEMEAGGARADLAYAQIATGSMWLTAGLTLASTGYLKGQITNNFSASRNLTQLGVVQQSVVDQEDGSMTDLSRLDGNPISFLLLAASVHETVQAYIDANAEELTPDELGDGILDIMSIPIGVGSQYAMSKSWSSGMAQLLDGIKNDTMGNYVQRSMGNLLPAGNTIKWFNQQYNDKYMREASNALEEIQAKIPGLSNSLPPRPDLLGLPISPVQRGLGGLSVAPTTVPNNHPVMQELRRLQLKTPNDVILGGVTRFVGAGDSKVKLDGTEKWNYMQFVRQLKDSEGKDLIDSLEEIIVSSDYQDPNTTDAKRNEILSKVYNKRKAFAVKALQYDSLMFSRGEPRPYAEAYDLYDYKRITPIASKVGTKVYSKSKALFGEVGMTRQDFIDKRDDEIVRSNLGIELFQ